MAVRVVVRSHSAGRSTNLAEVLEELREQALLVPTMLHDVGCDLRENALWLGRAWLSAVGVESGLYEKPLEQDDEDGLDMSTDDFAPMQAMMPTKLQNTRAALELDEAIPEKGTRLGGGTVMRL